MTRLRRPAPNHRVVVITIAGASILPMAAQTLPLVHAVTARAFVPVGVGLAEALLASETGRGAQHLHRA